MVTHYVGVDEGCPLPMALCIVTVLSAFIEIRQTFGQACEGEDIVAHVDGTDVLVSVGGIAMALQCFADIMGRMELRTHPHKANIRQLARHPDFEVGVAQTSSGPAIPVSSPFRRKTRLSGVPHFGNDEATTAADGVSPRAESATL